MMNLDEFKNSLTLEQPPAGISPCLAALWFDGKGDWEKSHQIAQDIETNDGAWVHAYLHRKEGDPGNARYWYNRAGRSMPEHSLEKEWEELAGTLIQESAF